MKTDRADCVVPLCKWEEGRDQQQIPAVVEGNECDEWLVKGPASVVVNIVVCMIVASWQGEEVTGTWELKGPATPATKMD